MQKGECGFPPGSFGLYHMEKRRGNIQKSKKDRKKDSLSAVRRGEIPACVPATAVIE